MASRRTHPSEPRHGLFPRSPEPNAQVPLKSGDNQPPRQKIQACHPMGHPPDTTTGHPTHVPVKGGNIRQPPQLHHGAGHHLLHNIPIGLLLRGTPRRLQLPPNGSVYRKPGIRPGGHEKGDSTRPRIFNRHNDTLLGSHAASRLGRYTLVFISDTKPPQPRNTHPDPGRTYAICPGSQTVSC